jgi:hypothetical protein
MRRVVQRVPIDKLVPTGSYQREALETEGESLASFSCRGEFMPTPLLSRLLEDVILSSEYHPYWFTGVGCEAPALSPTAPKGKRVQLMIFEDS